MMNNEMPRGGQSCFDMTRPRGMPPMASGDDCPGRSLAIAYVEWQKWQNVYPAEVGFERGTIFEDLDLPFLGEEVVCDD